MEGNVVLDKIGNIFFTTSGGTPSRKNSGYYNGSIPWVKSGELKQNVILETEENITKEAIQNSSAKIFPKGTLLIALYGATIGKLAFLGVDAATNQAICGIFDNGIINSKYTYYFLLFKKPSLVQLGTGGAQPNISQDVIKRQEFPIIPLPEQRAIVAKIEQLFSELDNGLNQLKKAQEQLKVYRQAVLKKAFEGELTKAWRAKQIDLPTAEELLEQISEERNKWLDKEIINGNTEAKRLRGKLKKNKFLIPGNEYHPRNWKWVSFLASCHLVVDCHNKTAPYEEDGIFLVRTSNVRDGKLKTNDNIRFVSQKTYEYWSRRCFPESGDILFTREAPMGEAAIIPEDTKVCLGQRMMLIRVFPQFLLPKYLLYNILSAPFQQRFTKNAIGTGVKHLRVGDVENLMFPLCSVEEQHQIVQEIEARLSVCDKVEETIRESLGKAEALRQSILKKAFEGKLLSEAELEACGKEHDWEAAEKLLERIKAEKGKGSKAKKKEVLA